MKIEELEEKLKCINSRLYLKETSSSKDYDVRRIEVKFGEFDKIYVAAMKVRPDLDIVWEPSGKIYLCLRPGEEAFIVIEDLVTPRAIYIKEKVEKTTEDAFLEDIRNEVTKRLEWEQREDERNIKLKEGEKKLKSLKPGTNSPSDGCNSGVKLRVKEIKAPRGGENYLNDQALCDLARRNSDPGDEDLFDGDEGYAVYYLVSNCSYFEKDFKYNVDNENLELEGGIKYTSSGVAYRCCIHGGDWELPVGFFIYWDGTRLRAYEPLKGNAINTINNSAFGNGQPCFPDADDEYCVCEFGERFDGVRDDIEINWDLCLEDFESILDVI